MDFKTAASLKLPVLGIGTWGIGGWSNRDTANDKQEIIAIKTALEMGIRHIDTAEFYGNGHAEEMIAIASDGFPRDELFITSKVRGTNLKYSQVIGACKKSLSRLKTDYIDLYLIHWPNPSVPMEETMKAMNFLQKEGLIRNIGVSNFSVPQMEEAMKFAKVVTNQIEYNLLAREKGQFISANMESEILPFCQKNYIFITAYRPFAGGDLFSRNIPLLDSLQEKYDKTRAQIALNWLISKKNVITIPKSSSPQRWKENLGGMGWKMGKNDTKSLDNLRL